MKRIGLLYMLFFFLPSLLLGQEGSAVHQMLKKKYGHAEYQKRRNCYDVCKLPNYKLHGVCDSLGNLIVPIQYDYIAYGGGRNSYWENSFEVHLNKKVGAYDFRKGKEIIPTRWKYVTEAHGYYFVTDENEKEGIYNPEGILIIPCEYDEIYSTRIKKDYYFLPERNGLMALANSKGHFLTSFKYGYLSSQKNHEKELIVAQKNSKWGIIDLKEQNIVPFVWDYIGTFSEGLYLCNKGGTYNPETKDVTGGYWGFIDENGNNIVPCIYQSASVFKDGVAQVSKDGTTSLLVNPLGGTNLQMANGGASIKVDTNIPETGRRDENTFAFIFANENYTHFTGADYSINDGKIFKEYCKKTFGLPEKNIRYYEDATYGNIVGAIQKMQDITDVYDGEAKIIFYYSGLGATDQGRERYLLPVDASLETLQTTGYSMQTLLGILNALKTEMTWVIVDAPFSGVDKRGKMLAQHRGVQIAPKPIQSKGNTIVCLSSDKEETSWSDKKYGHSLFTYALLEQIQNVKGRGKICDIVNNAVKWTPKETMTQFDKRQTPSVTIGSGIEHKWNEIKL